MDILEQLEKLSDGEGHLPKVAVTRDFLRAVAMEIRKLRVEAEAFDLVRHLSQASRINPLAAAAAVHLSRSEKSGVAPVDTTPDHA